MNTTTPMRARLVEYVPWMLRDYLTNQGPSTLIVLALIGVLSIFPMFVGANLQVREVPEELARRIAQSLTPMLGFIGSLFATNGIVANDRRMGFYRFFFAKPLSPVAFYALQFGAALVGMVAVTLVLMGVFATFVRPVFPLELLFVVVVMFVAYAGIGFLLSATLRFDWLSLVTVLLVANVGWSVWGQDTGWKNWLLHLLPPVHKTDGLYAIIMAPGVPIPWQSVAWLAGYGLACLGLGLLAVRKRPFGSG